MIRNSIIGKGLDLVARDYKADVVDVRAVTAVSKNEECKRKRYKMSISRKGGALYGSKSCSTSQPPQRDHIIVDDSRAQSLCVEYVDDNFMCLPSAERFSAHTGVCEILGSKNIRGERHELSMGDIVRFGSVGVMVVEIDRGDDNITSMSQAEISGIMNRVVSQDADQFHDIDSAIDTDEDSGEGAGESDCELDKANRLSQSSSPLCYICYEEGDEKDPLVSPCLCNGDTKYIHVNCLKKWNSSESTNDICLVTNLTVTRTCTICKAPYPSKAKLPDGTYVSLSPDRLKGPSITLMVVTRHSSSTMFSQARFQLSFNTLIGDRHLRPLLIGRSSQCDMVLKYRTVSTMHAEIHLENGAFSVLDVGSSNGTLRYIYRPLKLESGKTVNIKFGRTMVSLKPRRKLRLSTIFQGFTRSNVEAKESPFPKHISYTSSNDVLHVDDESGNATNNAS